MNGKPLHTHGTALRNWFLAALLFFSIAATIGALLRLIYSVDMPWLVFKPWLHAHSHVAMLGWLFPGFVIAILALEERRLPRGFAVWLWSAMATVTAMLIAFPIQGYGDVSITSSLAQIIVGYALVAQTWGRTRHWPRTGSGLLVRIALVFQLVSTAGIWAMGPIMSSGLAGSEWYYWSIQWFLHFQFNGWLWFAAMAIGSRWAERYGVHVRLDTTTTVLWATSTVFTYALAIAWSERHMAVLAVNSIGVTIQFVAAWRTMQAMRAARLQAYVRTTPWMRLLIGVMLLSMVVKVAAQAAVAIPAVANMALTLRNYVVGFVHLNTLGMATSLLFAFALLKGWFAEHLAIVRASLLGYVLGYAVSECLLFVQGTCFWAGVGTLPGYHWTLFGASALMAIAVWTLWITACVQAWSAREVEPQA